MYFILLTYLFCNWKFVSLNLPNLFPLLQSLPLWQPPVLFSILMSVSVLLCLLIYFSDTYISEIIQYPFFSVRLTLFSVIHSRSMHVVTNGKISLFFMSEQYYIVSIYVSYLLYPFVYWWALWRRIWQPTPVFFPGEVHWQRSLVGYRPWDHRIRHDHVTNTWLFPYLGYCK